MNSFEEKYASKKVNDELLQMNVEVNLKKTDEVNRTKINAKLHLNEFDIFLAHNSKDKKEVIVIKESLENRGLTPWIDIEQIPPGRWFQDILQETIRKIKSAAIFIGKYGLGKWQVIELRLFISQCVNRRIPIIPILLPGVSEIPEELLFLQELNWIKCSDNVESREFIDSIEWGITGVNPKSVRKRKIQDEDQI